MKCNEQDVTDVREAVEDLVAAYGPEVFAEALATSAVDLPLVQSLLAEDEIWMVTTMYPSSRLNRGRALNALKQIQDVTGIEIKVQPLAKCRLFVVLRGPRTEIERITPMLHEFGPMDKEMLVNKKDGSVVDIRPNTKQ